MTYMIFDHHQHVGSVANIVGGAAPTPPPGTDRAAALETDYQARVAVMEAFGIRQAALMPAHSYTRPGGLADTQAINDLLAAYRRRDPARFPAIIGTVEPRYGRAGLAEIERLHDVLQAQGVSWHHRQQGLPIDHPVMREYLRRMAEMGLVPYIHCYVGADFEELYRLRALAEDFPAVIFLCLDALTEADLFEQALALGRRLPNVCFDTTSQAVGPAGIERLVDVVGPTRLLFGSNLYSLTRPRHLAALEAVLAADLAPADRALILGGNARRILGVPAPPAVPSAE